MHPSADRIVFSENFAAFPALREVTRVLKNLVQPSEYYPLLLFCVGTIIMVVHQEASGQSKGEDY